MNTLLKKIKNSDIFTGSEKLTLEDALKDRTATQAYIDQIRWERDVMQEQLEDIGLGLGCKMDEVKDAISYYKNYKREKEDDRREFHESAKYWHKKAKEIANPIPNPEEIAKTFQTITLHIDWDTDGADVEELGLPTTFTIKTDIPPQLCHLAYQDMDIDAVAEWLSDTYGYLIHGYSFL